MGSLEGNSCDVNKLDGKEKSEKHSLVLKDKELELLSQFDKLLCDRFQIPKSKIEEHRKEILETVSGFLDLSIASSKIADTINIDQPGQIHIGNVINITENIVLNTEKNELELDDRKIRDYNNYFPMVDRLHWLAQPPVEKLTYLKRPAKYVIICHTASYEVFTQAENLLLMRLFQTFHIESKGWADIGYNFCIGSDGNVYEGRGWFAQGAHTASYNACSVGIAFIGCFLSNLPPATSLKKCKDLIAHGVRIGAISPDYELVAHSQCRPFLSPGDRLCEEIKSWDHFNPNITNTSPCKKDL